MTNTVAGDHPDDVQRLARDFDPARLTDDFFEDPYPTYSALREHDHVHPCADGSLFLTRYADLAAIYRDRVHFSSDKKTVFAPKFGIDSPLYEHHTSSLVFNDPPYHTRVRRQIVGALNPAAIKGMVAGLELLVDQLCDAMQERGQVDLIEDFAAAIPVEVIGNLLGVPHGERAPLRKWSLAILGALDPTLSSEAFSDGQRSVSEFLEFARVLVMERRRALRGDDDLLSRLIRDESGGEPLSERELLHNCIFLLNAGHETTTNLIGNGLALLLAAPEQCARIRADRALLPRAIEECLRFESPNQLGNRMVIEAVTIGGHRFEANTYLTLCIGAANRDPREFVLPEHFDIAREANRHLAFAAGGHACAGMSVARIEAQLAIDGFLRRFPRAALKAAGVRGRRARFRGLVSLPASVS